jgi:hypothetical protein
MADTDTHPEPVNLSTCYQGFRCGGIHPVHGRQQSDLVQIKKGVLELGKLRPVYQGKIGCTITLEKPDRGVFILEETGTIEREIAAIWQKHGIVPAQHNVKNHVDDAVDLKRAEAATNHWPFDEGAVRKGFIQLFGNAISIQYEFQNGYQEGLIQNLGNAILEIDTNSRKSGRTITG